MSRQDVLVTADWAEKNLGTDGIVFVEVDEDTTAYDGGHIPGAVKINWTTELQDPVRRDIVDKEQFEQLLSAKGVANDDTVVLYGGNNNWFAAYAYWEFKLYGHDDVKLLDGGRKKWELDGRTLDTDEVARPAHHLHGAGRRTCRSARSATRSSPPSAHKNLVDVRSPDEFSGKILAPAHLPQEQAQRPGHIPDGDQRAVEQGRQRGRHVQVRRGPARALRRGRARRLAADHRVLPHRRAVQPHLGRAARAARPRATSRTTTAAGPSTARSSACRSSWARGAKGRADVRRS